MIVPTATSAHQHNRTALNTTMYRNTAQHKTHSTAYRTHDVTRCSPLVVLALAHASIQCPSTHRQKKDNKTIYNKHI
jgi:hypothetical protein